MQEVKNQTITVEEVDKNGKSVVKIFELPDYDVSSEWKFSSSSSNNNDNDNDDKRHDDSNKIKKSVNKDLYGCDTSDKKNRKKCLKKRKKFLRKVFFGFSTLKMSSCS